VSLDRVTVSGDTVAVAVADAVADGVVVVVPPPVSTSGSGCGCGGGVAAGVPHAASSAGEIMAALMTERTMSLIGDRPS